MSNTVFAEGMGIFHKNSGGSGQAYPDVCLSPPPPPGGPAPVPYPNNLTASDLTKGSKTVRFEGSEGALEDISEVATSTGDEGGTQGGNVVTHKTKGKGFFMAWSFCVIVEGKGICRHGDPMGQNSASMPPGAQDIMATVNQAVHRALSPEEPCEEAYKADKHRHSMTKAQYDKVKSGPCWQCGATSPGGAAFTPDHQPPVVVRWYDGGCHMDEDEWKRDFQDPTSVFPHCSTCSNGQGGLSAVSQQLAERHAEIAASPQLTANMSFLAGLP